MRPYAVQRLWLSYAAEVAMGLRLALVFLLSSTYWAAMLTVRQLERLAVFQCCHLLCKDGVVMEYVCC